MLPPEQIQQIKQQLIQQIKTTFPEDKKESAIQKVLSMNDEQLEEFLVQNKLIKNHETIPQTQQCIFCSIVEGKTLSYKLDENKDAIAILEINPISKGHTIVIPKKHFSGIDELPPEALSLAQMIAKKIKTKLKPKEVKIYSANLFGHEIINILPIYENESIESERYKAYQEELERLKDILEKKPNAIKKPKKQEKKIKLPTRIP